jgi:hypothetical protein
LVERVPARYGASPFWAISKQADPRSVVSMGLAEVCLKPSTLPLSVVCLLFFRRVEILVVTSKDFSVFSTGEHLTEWWPIDA